MFDIICKPFSFLLNGIGWLLSPLFGESFSLSLPVSVIALVGVGVAWFFLVMPFVNDDNFLKTIEGEMKISLPWLTGAILLGIFAATPAEFRTESFVISLFFGADTKLLWNNFLDWPGFVRICFIAMVVGVVFLTIVNLMTKGLRGVITMMVGFLLVFLFGYTVQLLRVWLCTEIFGSFLAWVLNMLMLGPEAILTILLPISFVVFLMSPSSVRSYVKKQENKTRHTNINHVGRVARQEADHNSFFTVFSMPEVITGPYEHTYRRVNISANFAEYQSDHDSSIVTIHNSDIDMFGFSANTSAGYFHW